MPMNAVGYESTISNPLLGNILPIPDPTVQTTTFSEFLVPPGMNQVCHAGSMIATAVTPLRSQLRAPSLLAVVPIDVEPIASGLVWPTLWTGQQVMYSPYQLVVAEPLAALIQNSSSVVSRTFVHFCDGPLKPVTGKIYSIRFTLTATLITATWQLSVITFSTVLPAGDYQVVGCRVHSPNGVYFRLIFKGSIWRPGAPMQTSEAAQDWPIWRWGNSGVWDVFNNITPPSIEMVGVTDTAEVGIMDLIKIK